jgi:hypothetical protein
MGLRVVSRMRKERGRTMQRRKRAVVQLLGHPQV